VIIHPCKRSDLLNSWTQRNVTWEVQFRPVWISLAGIYIHLH